MSFNISNNSTRQLNKEIIDLLEQIDNFQYGHLNSFGSLGDIHKNIEVQVVDKIDGKEYKSTISIKKLKELIGRLELLAEEEVKLNEGIRKKKKEQELSHKYSDLLDHYRRFLDGYSGFSDDDLISVTAKISVQGYYTRDSCGKPIVVLQWTADRYKLVTTYIHEMMHAFYDPDLTKPMVCIPLVEEPLAEMGMLRFVTEFVRQNPIHRVLLRNAIGNVKVKQMEPAIAHYGFGAYLYENYSHIDWENLMYSSKGHVNATDPQYKSLETVLHASYSDSNLYPSTAQGLFNILSLHGNSVISPKPVPYFESDITFHDGVRLTQDELEDILREMRRDSTIADNLCYHLFGILFTDQIDKMSNEIAKNVISRDTFFGVEISKGRRIGNHLREMSKR